MEMQYVTLVILIVYVLYHIKDDNIFRPDTIFVLVILGSMAITGVKIAAYQSNYSWWYYLVLYIAVVIFCFSYYLTKKYRKSEYQKAKRINERIEYNSKTMKRIITMMWLVVIGSVAIMWFSLGAPPALSLNSNRSNYFIGGFGTIYLLNTVLFALLVFDHFQKSSISNTLYYFYIGTLTICVFLMANKYQIFTLAVMYFTIKSLLKKGQSVKSVLKILILVIVVFVVMYNTIYTKMYNFTGMDTIYWYGLNIPNQLAFLAQPYLYISNNFENLYHYMCVKHHFMFGYNFLYNSTRNISLCASVFGSKIVSYANEYGNSLQMPAMNTGTAFLIPYRDFGIGGIFLYAMIIGVVAGKSEKRLLEKRSFLSVYIYSYVMTSVFFSFFTESFFSKPFLINIAVAIILDFLLSNKIRLTD